MILPGVRDTRYGIKGSALVGLNIKTGEVVNVPNSSWVKSLVRKCLISCSR